MKRHLEVLFSPAEFATLPNRDLGDATCVVFDVLRATTSMLTALENGATAIFPVRDIPEALDLKARFPQALLAGERNGLRIPASLAHGNEFDLGNSPREFTPERVRGRALIMTTTNGTRALRACANARSVIVACFRNLRTVAQHLRQISPGTLSLVCGGTFEEAALEDALAAGRLCADLWPQFTRGHVADSAAIALALYERWQADLPGAMRMARNGRRLLEHPALRDDLPYCLEQDVSSAIPILQADGAVRLP